MVQISSPPPRTSTQMVSARRAGVAAALIRLGRNRMQRQGRSRDIARNPILYAGGSRRQDGHRQHPNPVIGFPCAGATEKLLPSVLALNVQFMTSA
ncbi:hypothetical protein [Streptomyces atratus]|uniref:Uncharacterized protein n=1 Tax=Streptomyces atratus TaxID=1893 RepID=A0A1K2F7I0_STRAR|nr:hypothetical protein [Streptomyces atratus]SFY43350.1 hypothetical protein SAMN02787144_103553 [Streptomyces atratus]